MDEPYKHYAKWSKPDTQKKYDMIPLCKISSVGTFVETENRWEVTRAGGRESWCSGYRVSIWGDCVLERDSDDGCTVQYCECTLCL